MSDFIKAIILGIIEGLTEFIPVSSTGHLIIVGESLAFSTGNTATFDIAIQLGAILAVVILYRDFFIELFNMKSGINSNIIRIFWAILPALALGFFAHSTIKTHLFSTTTVIWALLVGGIIMLITDRYHPPTKTITVDTMTTKQALIVGLAQCAALWPGMSRSGSTIVGGLLAGLNYETSAKFSFIISVPVMIAAVAYDLLKSAASLTVLDFQLIAVGFVVSFIVAFLAIKTFLKLLVNYRLAPFAIYRIILAIILLV